MQCLSTAPTSTGEHNRTPSTFSPWFRMPSRATAYNVPHARTVNNVARADDTAGAAGKARARSSQNDLDRQVRRSAARCRPRSSPSPSPPTPKVPLLSPAPRSPATKMAAPDRTFSDGSTGASLTLADILGFLKCEVSTRCFTEGEKLLEVGHIVFAGAMQRSAEKVKVYGLFPQTSGLQADPHQIEIELEIARKKVVQITSDCSCVAGESEKCKHTTALLLHCYR